MKIHRFHINHPLTDRLTLTDDSLLKQWRQVLRFAPGTSIELFDGNRGAIFELTTLEKKSATLQRTSDFATHRPARDVWLFFAPVKRDNTELIIQKATELGATHFVPVISERTVVREINEDRLRKIAIEAAEQCGRTDIPQLHPALTLQKIPDEFPEITLYAADQQFTDFESASDAAPLGLIVGPEGGWTPAERDWLSTHARPINLGQFTLRAETAVIVGLHEVVRRG